LVLVALGASGLVCQRIAARGRFAVAYSTYGAGPGGARALFLLTESLGRRPVRWAEDFGRLPEQGVLVALGGCELLSSREVSREEKRRLLAWVKRGGVLLVAGAHDYLSPELGVTMDRPVGSCVPRAGLLGALIRATEDGGAGAEPADGGVPTAEQLAMDPAAALTRATETDPLPPVQWAASVGAPLTGLGAVPLRDPARVEVRELPRSVVVLRLADERVAGVIVRQGRGAVIALASASPLLNRELRLADGGALYARLLRAFPRRGPVIFDEFHLGVGERRSLVRYLGDLGGGPFLLQLLVIALFALWRLGARFGGARHPVPPPPAGTASYVAGIASLYAKAGDPVATANILVKRALVRIAAHHHLPHSDAELLGTALEDRGRKTEAALVRKLAALSTAELQSGAELVHRAREIDAALAAATQNELGTK
jgi:hypothetical protein